MFSNKWLALAFSLAAVAPFGSVDAAAYGTYSGGYQSGASDTVTRTTSAYWSTSSPVHHLIQVGLNSTGGSAFMFTPSNISAAVGDTVTFQFHAKNHTVTQSSFFEPCKALAETSTTGQIGFKSGFVPVSPNQTTDFPTFSITVNDTQPIWGYCGQQGPPVHCTSGMVFSINAVESSAHNFAAFLDLAESSGVNCPATDNTGSLLTSSNTTTDQLGNEFAVCNYSTAGECTYFSDGSFSSGSSDCPQGLPQASGSGVSSTASATSTATYSATGVNCPPVDKTGSALTSSSTTTDEDGNLFAVCTYPTAGTCTFFSDGSFSSGSSDCPQGLPQASGFGASTTVMATSTAASSATSVNCPPVDKAGSALTSSSTTTDEDGNLFAVCTYPTAGVCTFFSDGSFSSGSSECPQGLPQASGFGLSTTAMAMATSTATSSATSVNCPPVDKTGSALTSSSTTTDEDGNLFAVCTYPTAGVCTFFSDGSFSSGSSNCPQGLPQASGFGTSGHLADDLSLTGDSSSSNGKPSVLLIVLVALNGALLIGLVVFAILYFRQRRVAGRSTRHRQLYTSIGASGDPMFVAPSKYDEKEIEAGDETPLTHGLAHGPYYDPHEPGRMSTSSRMH